MVRRVSPLVLLLVLPLVLLLNGGACHKPARPAPASSSPPPALLDDWPVVDVGVETRGNSSFDRTGGNDDGFTGTHSTLYVNAAGEHVIVDAAGPGRLQTFWFTSGQGGHAPLSLGRIRLYLDDGDAPLVSADANDLFAGRTPGFPPDLVFDNTRSTGGFVSWVRIPFKQRLRITTENKPFFYNAAYQTLPAGTPVRSWKPTDDDPAWHALFASARAPWDESLNSAGLKEVPLDHTHEGSGVVDALVFRPTERPTAAALQSARVRITWDDDSAPAVDAPLGAFFGSGLGDVQVRAVAFRMDAGLYQSRFPMPFWKRLHIQVQGVRGRLWLRIGPQRFVRGVAGHFHASHHESALTDYPDDFEALSFAGAGKLVGTVLTVRPPSAATDKQWWEGDLRSYADGRRTPGVHGTGHEDDHFGGWSNEFFDGPFSLPMHGEPSTEITDRGRQHNGNVTMYRLWPGISFLGSLHHSFEHGTENWRAVGYSAVSFFYALPRARLRPTDRVVICDQRSRTQHTFSADGEDVAVTLTSVFEGRTGVTAVTACVRAHAGAVSFRLTLDPENQGVFLRRMFDAAAARQSALVDVDGARVGHFYVAESNATLRWAERDLFIPQRFSSGKSVVTVTITPDAGAPLWNAAEYRALCVTPP